LDLDVKEIEDKYSLFTHTLLCNWLTQVGEVRRAAQAQQ